MLIVDHSKQGYLIIKEQIWLSLIVPVFLGGTALYFFIKAGFNYADKNDFIGGVACSFFFALFVLFGKQSIYEFDLKRQIIRRKVRGALGSTMETLKFSDIKSVSVALSVEGYDTPLSGVVLTTKDGRTLPLSKAFYGIYRKGASPPELEQLIQDVLKLRTGGVPKNAIKKNTE